MNATTAVRDSLHSAFARGRGRRLSVGRGALFCGAFALLLLLMQMGGRAQAVTDPLSYAGGFLITGNYVVGGIDLTEQLNPPDINGLSSGEIKISGVPQDADIVAAFLYWETITLAANLSQATGVMFRGNPIDIDDVVTVKKSTQALTGNSATCWSSGTPLAMTHFKADVLRFFPVRKDVNNKLTGKRLVNSADLTAHGEASNTVMLPTRSGNQVPESAGASLVIVYRDPSQPLRKVVFYDGIHIQNSLTEATTQTLGGFYWSSSAKSAKITHILGSGQPNNNERIFFSGGTNTQISPISGDPIPGGTASQRSWSVDTSLVTPITQTFDVSQYMNPPNTVPAGTFGETVTTSIDHTPGGSYDCLTWGAVIFSTAVRDTDPNSDNALLPGDGIPDGLEDSTSGRTDPDGQVLPNLNAMGASSSHRDLFVEINAMRTTQAKTHGSSQYPYSGSANPPVVSVSVPVHSHMPTPDMLEMAGDKYFEHGIHVHFDVGDVAAYHNLGVIAHTDWTDDYSAPVGANDKYLVPTAYASGGEVVDERACVATEPPCQFPAFPGVVGWKFGVELYRDFPVKDNGDELFTATDLEHWQQGTGQGYGQHRQRFDPNRMGIFHYLLFAHYRGLPKSEFRCRASSTDPTPVPDDGTGACLPPKVVNPDFYIPSSSSGFADRPGNTAMVTLGRWDEFVGRPFVRAATMFHELGHNLNLSHGGWTPSFGNKVLSTPTYIEPTCKSNYLSSMSYAFQVHGLFTDDDNIHFDYSTADHDDISETPSSPSDLALFPTVAYRSAWYAPATSQLAVTQGVSAATRYCNGGKFDPAAPPAATARVVAELSADPIDWNGDTTTNAANPGQDVNFDAQLSATQRGFSDWANLRLDQLNAGRKILKLHLGEIDLPAGVDLYGEGGVDLFGEGGVDLFGEGGVDLFGEGGVDLYGEGGVDLYGEGGVDLFGEGGVDLFGEGGVDLFGESGQPQELSLEGAKGLGRGVPYALAACIVGEPGCVPPAPPSPPTSQTNHARRITFNSPAFGHVGLYHVSRKRGDANSSYPFVTPVITPAPTPAGTTTTRAFNDNEQLPDYLFNFNNGITDLMFTYRTRAEFDDETPHVFSAFSKSVTINPVNSAPTAVADFYSTQRNSKTLRRDTRATGVLGNDTDVDSPTSILRAVRVTTLGTNPCPGPLHGTVTLNPDGTFIYNVDPNFNSGEDFFCYKADDGFWSADPTIPLSPFSGDQLVTITIMGR